jgi:hypothetical protein
MKKLILILSFIASIIISSCRNQSKSSIIGKWLIRDTSFNEGFKVHEKRYFVFDSTNYYYTREVTEINQYRINGDTMFSRKRSDTSLIDTSIFKMINKDSILVKVNRESKANGYQDWYLVRIK